MSNWRDPSPSDYKLPSRDDSSLDNSMENDNTYLNYKKIFLIFRNIFLLIALLYFSLSLNSLRVQVNSLTRQIKIPYPEISNSQELTENDIRKLIAYYRLENFPNVDNKLLINSREIDNFIQDNISEDELNRKFTILSMLFNEIDSGRVSVHSKDELNQLVRQIEVSLHNQKSSSHQHLALYVQRF